MTTLFASPSFAPITSEIARQANITEGRIDFDTFQDGWPNNAVGSVEKNVEGKEVWYLADISNKHDFFDNLSVIYALPRYYAKKVQIIIPYFPTGTMERVDTEGQIATAKTLARALSATPAGEMGMTTFHTFDIHALQERFYFGDTVSLQLHSALDLVKERVKNVMNLSVAFPDEGAYKRFGKAFPEIPKIICTKVRAGNDRIVTVKEGEVTGRNVLIVDDLIQSGGTIRESAKKLREMGAASVSAYATHGVFPGNPESLIEALDQLYLTDSIPKNRERFGENAKVEILSIAPLVSRIIQKSMNKSEFE